MMFSSSTTPVVFLLLHVHLHSVFATAINEAVDPAKTLAMRTATDQLTAYNSLSDSDYVYDWNSILSSISSSSSSSVSSKSASSSSSSSSSSSPGSVLFADAATWPILAAGESQMSASQINLEACAMLSPHSHRATKLAIAVNGTVQTWMRLANGATDRVTNLTPGMMTVFPRGAMHTMSNQGCTPARLYTFFDSADPGTLSFAQAFMATGPQVAKAVMPFLQQVDANNNSESWNVTSNLIPSLGLGAQTGTEECLKKCGLA